MNAVCVMLDDAAIAALEQSLLKLLLVVSNADAALQDQLSDGVGWQCHGGVLRFQLQGLYQQLELKNTLCYAQFRQRIYQTQLNHVLAQQGLKIGIAENNDKVDESYYQLFKL